MTMIQSATPFTLATLERKRLEKFRREAKDVRIHNRLSALLWLADGYSAEEVAALQGVCTRTIGNWLALYRTGGLDLLRRLDHQGDPG
jgi:transposase